MARSELASTPDFVADVALRHGGTVHVRPTRHGDGPRLGAFLAALSERDRYLRFFSAAVNAERTAEALVAAPGLGLVAVTGDDEVVAHALYATIDGGCEAEVAFAVAAGWQAHGLATTLLAELAQGAAASGVRTFTASVLPANHRMIRVFRESGFPVEVATADGELHVTFPTSLTASGRRRFEEREATAAASAVAHVLRPASIAVLGASPGSDGARIVANLEAGDYSGSLSATVAGADADLELAVLAVPADAVVAAARDCAAHGVRTLVVTTSVGPQVGARLLEICRAAGMRMVGPDSRGVGNTAPSVALRATVAGGAPRRGRVALASQSGAIAGAALDRARRSGVGVSSWVALGDKADLSGNDFLQFWERDPDTDVVMLYLESFGNPHRFGRIARRLSAAKPVIAVKSGRTAAGHQVGGSRTGALLAAADTTVDALFRHAGVIRADTVEEMVDVAAVLTRQPLPRGNRVAIVTDAGGPGLLCADACVANGLRVPATGAVNLGHSATAHDYADAVRALVADPDVDAVIAVRAGRAGGVAAAIDAVAAGPEAAATTVLRVVMGHDRHAAERGVPVFGTVEEAARTLGHVVRHAARARRAPDPAVPPPGADPDRAAAIIAAELAGGADWLDAGAVRALLTAYGIPLARDGAAASGTELILGVVGDPHFGALVAVGAGGPAAELIGDVQVRLAPLGPRAAGEMLRELRTFPQLDGYRGARPANVAGVENLIVRVAALAAAHPEVAELDCDPLVAGPEEAVVVSARVRLRRPPAPRPYGALDR